jgi:hypothetical protein
LSELPSRRKTRRAVPDEKCLGLLLDDPLDRALEVGPGHQRQINQVQVQRGRCRLRLLSFTFAHRAVPAAHEGNPREPW